MDITSVLERTGGSLGARTVFSEPIEREGATVILAAKLAGGGGGGEGEQKGAPGGTGSGLGFGVGAKPAGAFIIRGGRVRWRPAVDVNRVILGGQLVAVTLLLTIRALGSRRRAAFAPAFGSRRGRRVFARRMARRFARG